MISLGIIFHLAAVILPPLAYQSDGPSGVSPIIQTATAPVRPYGEFLHLNRGYAFFAPDPGPSHLFQIARLNEENLPEEEWLYPSLDHQWPRLSYHRHFMLAEYLNRIHRPVDFPEGLDQSIIADLQLERRRYEHVRRSMIEKMRKELSHENIALRRIEHALLLPQDYLSGIQIDDRRTYQVLGDGPVFSDPDTAEGAPTLQSAEEPISPGTAPLDRTTESTVPSP